MFNRVFACIPLSLLCGCAIVMASKLPISRPPEELAKGTAMDHVDHRFGYPIAAGVDNDGKYVEQLQFVDGVSVGWKIARICIHGTLDAATYCLWEFAGTPIELLNSDYPLHVYYVAYDSEGNIDYAVSSDSPQGRKLSELSWTIPLVSDLRVNKDSSIRMRYRQGLK
jgi:hypothetical protein